MTEFHCRYENHFGQAILGFCINVDCCQTPQFCVKCLNSYKQKHSSKCLDFKTIKENLQQYIKTEQQAQEQLNDINKSFQKLFAHSLKYIQNNLDKLQNMNEALEKKDYLKVKSKINFFRKYFSEVEQTQKSQFLTSLNSILLTLTNAIQDYARIEDKLNISSEENNQQYFNKVKGIFDQGEQLFKEKKYQEALGQVNDSILMGYNHDFVYNLKAITLNHLNQYDEALKCFDLALLNNQCYESAYNNKGALLNKIGNFEEALLYFEKAIELNPNNDLAYFNKGYALSNLQNYQEAFFAFERATQLNNKNENALHFQGIYKIYNIILGITLLKLNRYDDAIYCFHSAIKLNQMNDEAYEKKAFCLHMLSNFNEALKNYDQAIYIKRTANKFKCKADTLLALGRKIEAKQYYHEALRIGNLSSEQEQILYKLVSL